MKRLTNIEELAQIAGGQLTVETSGQYDLGYIIGRGIGSIYKIYFYISVILPYQF